ncbi:Primosomal replication protein N [Vibrio nigripulchritudo MADA3029]|uniref:Replication restart protein PriB n=2 Tax=Vibrio nigripulchritudo TaxID=28173 RepID=U4K2L7_9VIBR|nr:MULTISPECIES: primosomal replication protein N [Vibrio]EGU56598.1 primosomal replication protein N [Vibrio nigripulchritudo ATCC 27043]UAB70631.1 primosomal replication protein N [Vibrio sp. SCSIO 43132]CCN37887.1 Primosomal replication protein N [Vibrio nigripulchritudo AM115]CCN44418.1 Primosomal replication protein N [Vibrio nigripulchritudo FTn2]CCN46444.1 Primosomal replication protein N [Vibrio nigripulchritudo MADA3020]
MTNRMELSGTVAKAPIRSQSPAGVPHCRFWLEHRSTVLEADLPRQVYCRMPVVISGQKSKELTQELVIGSHIKVSGFVAYQTSRNGNGKLVLHADNIIHI